MSMHRQLAGIGIAVFLCSPCSYAQESLVGTYKGSFEFLSAGARKFNVPVTLDITSAENGKLVGKARHGSGACIGDFSVDGTYEGNKVDIKVGEGALKGCGNFTVNVTAQSNKLMGKWGKYDIELSK